MRAPWPFAKLDARMAQPVRGPRRVLLSTGKLNPVHLGHTANFDYAAAMLEAEHGLEVVGGFLSPSHDLYVASACRTGPVFPADQRLALCELATANHPWLAVGAWESQVAGYWPDFPEVIGALAVALHERFGADAPGVLYVCGADHFEHNVRHVRLPGVCAVNREGGSVASDPARGVYAVRPADNRFHGLSSTKIRAALSSRDLATLQAGLHPRVLEALLAWPPSQK
jgi:nicotinic acid mononucleotide adenylyltransferase